MLSNLSPLFRHVRQWINKNREQLGEIIRAAVQQKKTSLCGNRDTDLIGDSEIATSLEAFFGKKNLNVTQQFCAIVRRQSVEKYDMALN